MGANGQRQCTFCSGQVRPQKCGSNKHRWRCVDKNCRKWYGWVKSNEEIPKKPRKKVKQKRSAHPKVLTATSEDKIEDDNGVIVFYCLIISRKLKLFDSCPASLSSQAEAALAAAEIQSLGSCCSDDPSNAMLEQKNVEGVKRKLGRPPKEHGLKIRLKGLKDKKEEARQRCKYVRRRNRRESCNNSVSRTYLEQKKPSPLPLTEEEKNYEPCEIEKRVRWWLSEKRRSDPSPERPFETKTINSCAAFRMISQALKATAVTRADAVQSVSGSLDILMDSLMGSLGPLLTVASVAFDNLIPEDLSQMLWRASAIHIPTFQ
ncbi:hypothetical protein DICVIV_12581 [Dictyocaulus viviparus]|uniref:Uncharacterized protein n=1 Tax=Dictyocaulus viviparus TaxID=29172 RepID=A0A0D8XCF1_DICVI|nr:hypothetical protein DICVIV_12581 [Dictyocaulus viviparus]